MEVSTTEVVKFSTMVFVALKATVVPDYGKELCIHTNLYESCRAWNRVCTGTGTEFGVC